MSDMQIVARTAGACVTFMVAFTAMAFLNADLDVPSDVGFKAAVGVGIIAVMLYVAILFW